MRKINKTAAAVAVAAVAVTGTGVAYAYWTTSGSGTGTGSTAPGNASALTVAGNVANAVFPGDSAQTVTATVTNSGSENYKVQTLSAWVDTNKGSDCDGSNYTINGVNTAVSAATAVPITITAADLAPNGTQTATFPFKFNNKGTVQDLCKGAAVTIHYIAG